MGRNKLKRRDYFNKASAQSSVSPFRASLSKSSVIISGSIKSLCISDFFTKLFPILPSHWKLVLKISVASLGLELKSKILWRLYEISGFNFQIPKYVIRILDGTSVPV
ncbi:hypothetical protein HAX54_009946 [Datura stramonium]|uniref:Uncharacterized protein n=1 Tax=Datura stramonium TaxID=4076 RepID=A0ABS8TI42_DATST|nr:hypothetical protein [Datura stramonium]